MNSDNVEHAVTALSLQDKAVILLEALHQRCAQLFVAGAD
jgi:hypothetical protein